MTAPDEPASGDRSEGADSGDARGSDAVELARLRALVGPDERSYARLRADRDGAVDAAREAEAAVGELRGTIAEMRVQLARARQDQDTYQRGLTLVRRTRDRLAAAKRRCLGVLSRS
jgi:hypothetical protein